MGGWGSRYITYANDIHVAKREAALITLQGDCGHAVFQYHADNQRTRGQQVAIAAAQFLHAGNGVPHNMGSTWLGRSQYPFDVMMTQEYARYINFAGLDVARALDQYLRSITLSCIPARINAVTHAFADAYFHDNCKPMTPSAPPFKNADAVFVFAYSIFILSIDTYYNSDDCKPTKDGWISDNRGINDGEDFPNVYLADVYDRITASPIAHVWPKCECADGQCVNSFIPTPART